MPPPDARRHRHPPVTAAHRSQPPLSFDFAMAEDVEAHLRCSSSMMLMATAACMPTPAQHAHHWTTKLPRSSSSSTRSTARSAHVATIFTLAKRRHRRPPLSSSFQLSASTAQAASRHPSSHSVAMIHACWLPPHLATSISATPKLSTPAVPPDRSSHPPKKPIFTLSSLPIPSWLTVHHCHDHKFLLPPL